MNQPTYEIKLELVRLQSTKLAGLISVPKAKWMYEFDVPPVCTAAWDAKAWVKWVDNNGQWSLKEDRT